MPRKIPRVFAAMLEFRSNLFGKLPWIPQGFLSHQLPTNDQEIVSVPTDWGAIVTP